MALFPFPAAIDFVTHLIIYIYFIFNLRVRFSGKDSVLPKKIWQGLASWANLREGLSGYYKYFTNFANPKCAALPLSPPFSCVIIRSFFSLALPSRFPCR
ncbi:hypothetical protein OIU76_013971 [Salix suchowensis]|nr:hypothetical protein OIU76_013971 [Salix suchowensis]